MTPRNAGDRLPCPTCGKRVAVYVPRRGDGSLVLMRPHARKKNDPCPGSKRPA